MKTIKLSRRSKVMTALAACFMTIVFLSAGKGKKSNAYITQSVVVGNIEKNIVAIGEISAAQLINIGAQASGQIKELHVKVGQHVLKNDLIAQIDSTTQLNDLNTELAVEQTRSAQLASREIALKIAQQQYAREKKLKMDDATSKTNLENVENTLAKAKADIAETKSLIIQARIAVQKAQTNLDYTRILAPTAGTIVSIPVEEGQTINATQETPTIAQLADLENMQIKIKISEADITKIEPGMNVKFNILSEPNITYVERLESIEPAFTTLQSKNKLYESKEQQNNAVYYYGKITIKNNDGKFRIGMTTQNTIMIAKSENTKIIPSAAVHEHNSRRHVFVLSAKNKPERREVSIGISDNLNTEVLSGLQPGEKVVISEMTDSEINAAIDKIQ